MARNGSGTFTLPFPSFQANTTIVASEVNSNNSDIADALTASIAKDGQTTPTANLPMGGFKLTGMGIGSAAADSVHLRQVQYQAWSWGGTAGGTADAIMLTPSPAIGAYAAGQAFRFIAASNNTGAVTVNVSAVGAKAIQNNGGALAANEIVSGEMYEIIYDGTQFQLLHIVRQTIGVDVQAQSAVLDDLNTLGAAAADGEVIVATGAGAFAYESGATLRTSIGVGTGDTPQFTGTELQSTTADATPGPSLDLYRNSPSPDDLDLTGEINFYAEDDADNKELYAAIQSRIIDASSTTEDGQLAFKVVVGGSLDTALAVRAGIFTPDATGGDTGAGTINASEFYRDGNILVKRFISTGSAITGDSAHAFAHGLGAEPDLVKVIIQCTTTDQGWSVGDRVVLTGAFYESAAGEDVGPLCEIDATNVTVHVGDSIGVFNKSTYEIGFIVLSRWDLYVKAFKFAA